MRKYNFKNFKGFFYIDEFEYSEDDYEIMDEFGNFIDHVYTDNIKKVIKDLQNCKDEFEFFEHAINRYDYGTTPQDIMKTYIYDISEGVFPNDMSDELKDEIKDILFDIEFMTDEELCEKYDINKVGKYYFRGNW